MRGCGHRRRAFVAASDERDSGIVECVQQAQKALSGNAESARKSVDLKAPDQKFRGSLSHGRIP